MFRIFVTLCVVLGATPTLADETLRIGLQKTGTFAWQLDVIRRHGLAAAGLDLKISEYASPDAGKLALNSGSVDLAVVDWLWVARARALGAKLLFYPYSSAVGSVMVKGDSPVRNIDDLKGRVLAVAGGPLDKSWLIVQAAAMRQGIDLKREATLAVWRAAADFPEVAAGRSRGEPQFLEFLRQAGGSGLSPYPRRTRGAGGPRAERTGRAGRLRVFRGIRSQPQEHDRSLHRGRAEGR